MANKPGLEKEVMVKKEKKENRKTIWSSFSHHTTLLDLFLKLGLNRQSKEGCCLLIP